MSYKFPVQTTNSFKDLEDKLQGFSFELQGKLAWLSHGFGLADRVVDSRDEKPYIFPAIYQDINKKDALSMMPSDLYNAFCFWVKDEEIKINDWSRLIVKVSCIFYCDLRNIAPTENWKLTKTKIRQDILEAFRQVQYSGLGVLNPESIIEDDLTTIYDGFSIEQVDNKYKMLPKYAARVNFEFGLLRDCSSFNSYA